jgi:membrane-associated phospholipid phosphatase
MDGELSQGSSSSAARRWWATWIRRDLPHWWLPTLIAVTTAYTLLTLLVMAGSSLTEIDRSIYDLHLVPIGSPLRLPVQLWVFLGQRAPAMIIAGLVAVWSAHRLRSARPLILYVLASIGFVGSVLPFKYLTGRIGPRYTEVAHTVWDGGNIFPSGHVTGTVVMYGLIAILAPHAYRRVLTIVAIVLAVTVGAGTTALNLHWATDAVGGWFNGALVLLIVWAITPRVEQIVTFYWRRLSHWYRATTGTLSFDAAELRDDDRPAATRR